MTKRIGILTGSGNCGGVNAILRAATRDAPSAYVWEVSGIRNASMGLSRDPARPAAARWGRGDG